MVMEAYMKNRKIFFGICLAIIFVSTIGVLYYKNNSIEHKIKAEIEQIIEKEKSSKYFEDSEYNKIRQFIDKMTVVRYTEPEVKVFKIPDSNTLSVLFRAKIENVEEGEAISYMTLTLNDEDKVDSVVISSWITISKEKSNF
jgi:H+/gluconate symporter-like permease